MVLQPTIVLEVIAKPELLATYLGDKIKKTQASNVTARYLTGPPRINNHLLYKVRDRGFCLLDEENQHPKEQQFKTHIICPRPGGVIIAAPPALDALSPPCLRC